MAQQRISAETFCEDSAAYELGGTKRRRRSIDTTEQDAGVASVFSRQQMLTHIWKHLNGVELLKLRFISKNWRTWVDSLGDEWWCELFADLTNSYPPPLRQLFLSVFEPCTSQALIPYAPTYRQRYRIFLTTGVIFQTTQDLHHFEPEEIPPPRVRRKRLWADLAQAISYSYPDDVLFLRRGTHRLPENYVWEKPLVLVGEEHNENVISSYISNCSVVGAHPEQVFSIHSISCVHVDIRTAFVKAHRCVISNIVVDSGGSGHFAGCMIRSTPLASLKPGWVSICLEPNTWYGEPLPNAKDSPPTWATSLAEELLQKLEANRFNWILQSSLVKTFLSLNRFPHPERGQISKIIRERVLPIIWDDFRTKRDTTEAFVPLGTLLKTQEKGLKETIKALGIQDIIMSLFESQELDGDTKITLEFIYLLQTLQLWDLDYKAHVNLFFDSIKKWIGNPPILFQLLSVTWGFLDDLGISLQFNLVNREKLLIIIEVMKAYHTNAPILEASCGILDSVPHPQLVGEEGIRKELFHQVMQAAKQMVSCPKTIVINLINSCFAYPDMRQIFTEYDGINILFETLEIKPNKGVEKTVLWLINSLLHYDDAVPLLNSAIPLLKKSTFLRQDRSAIFETLACHAKKNPAVVPDVLVQLRGYMSSEVTWTTRDIWRMIDALGILAMLYNSPQTCQDILHQIQRIAMAMEHSDLNRIDKWLRWVQLCINAQDKSQIPSLPLSTTQIVLYSDGLTVRSMSQGFGSGVFGIGVESGKWYYEVQLLTNSIFQIGWVTNVDTFVWNGVDELGVGDNEYSWGVDFYRLLFWNGDPIPYGKVKWAVNDVVGFFLDIDERVMSFSLNGVSSGPACRGFELRGPMVPGISMAPDQECIFNFGDTAFVYPPEDGYLPLSSSKDVTKEKI